jgi:hypothetical protein
VWFVVAEEFEGLKQVVVAEGMEEEGGWGTNSSFGDAGTGSASRAKCLRLV